MAVTTSISTKEFLRISTLCYKGKKCTVSLHQNAGSTLDADSTIADWDVVKLSGNGYADYVVAALPDGGLDTGSDDRWEIGETDGPNKYILAEFEATGSGFTFNTVVVRIASENYPHSILVEAPNVTVAPGQIITYRIQLLIDNI
jgi:hypothetical protein